MLLDKAQVNELAKPFVAMANTLAEFYNDPENKRKYQEWYFKKYGCKPNEV